MRILFFFLPEILVLMGGWLDFLNIQLYLSRTKVGARSIVFLVSTYQAKHLNFDEHAASLPKTACLDELVAVFPKNIGISTPNLR